MDSPELKGLMRTLSTDQGSGFTSEVMDILLAVLVLGVKVHNMTAVANSEGLGATSLSTMCSQESLQRLTRKVM